MDGLSVQCGVDIGIVSQRGGQHDRRNLLGQQVHEHGAQVQPGNAGALYQETIDLQPQTLRVNPTLAQIFLVVFSWQVTLAMKQLCTLFHRMLERQIFQPVQRVMVNEGTHRPEIRDRLGGHVDHAANF